MDRFTTQARWCTPVGMGPYDLPTIQTWDVQTDSVQHRVDPHGCCLRCRMVLDLGNFVLKAPHPENYDPREPYRRALEMLNAPLPEDDHG